MKPAGPITEPHPIEECYGSKLHCWSHDVDEPDQPAYISCFECKHVYRSAEELVAEHNKHLDPAWNEPAVTDPELVHCCPLCIHDW